MPNQNKSTLRLLYLVGFIFALHIAIPYFIGSTYLTAVLKDSISETRVEQMVSMVYVLAALITFLFFIKIPKILSHYGNYRTVMTLSTLNLIALLVLAFTAHPLWSILSFVIFEITSFLISYCADVFLEHNSTVGETGVIRTIYLTCINLAWLFGPLIAGMLLGGSNFSRVFFVAALFMVPVILLLHYNLKKMSDPVYNTFDFWQTIKEIRQNKNVEEILACNFILQFFYACMVIYTPIYLNVHLGFDWGSIGKIFTVMLLPFVLIQYPIGYLADKRFGEKSMLTIGFFIMGTATFIIPFFADNSLLFWSLLLFTTRIGAAMVEAMADVYFFKNISDKDANIISIYRIVAPLSYIVAPALVILILQFLPFEYIFFLLGILVLYGMRFSLVLKDTR